MVYWNPTIIIPVMKMDKRQRITEESKKIKGLDTLRIIRSFDPC